VRDEIEQLRTEVAWQRQRRINATMALSAADALANTLRALVAEQHDEIERLTADLAAERALADQLADALRWHGGLRLRWHGDVRDEIEQLRTEVARQRQRRTLGITHKALDAYEEARHGR